MIEKVDYESCPKQNATLLDLAKEISEPPQAHTVFSDSEAYYESPPVMKSRKHIRKDISS